MISSQIAEFAKLTFLRKVRDIGIPLLSIIRIQPGETDVSDVKQ